MPVEVERVGGHATRVREVGLEAGSEGREASRVECDGRREVEGQALRTHRRRAVVWPVYTGQATVGGRAMRYTTA